jgi:hypothetical protein
MGLPIEQGTLFQCARALRRNLAGFTQSSYKRPFSFKCTVDIKDLLGMIRVSRSQISKSLYYGNLSESELSFVEDTLKEKLNNLK